MDAMSDPDIHTVVVMSSAQVGKTELLINSIGYYAHQDPSPILLLQPTLEMAETFSKDRLAPMVRDTKELERVFAPAKSKGSGNTLRHKSFIGGHITMAGANSPASLASRPIRVVLMDEVDRFPISAGTEGDPVNLAKKRTTTFHNRKIMMVSTPTLKGLSRIEMAYLEGDQRKYNVCCPHCKTYQPMEWKNVIWEKDRPETAHYVCPDCGAVWTERDRLRAIHDGKWVAESESIGIASFHLNELISPWSTPANMATAFVQANVGGSELLKTWVNTSLGELWEEDAEEVDPNALTSFSENFDIESLPSDIILVTCGVDTQKDRLECQLVGWDDKGFPYIIAHDQLWGDPNRHEVWADLDRYLALTVGGLKITQTLIDSGGANTEAVYRYVKQRHGKRIFACKGEGGVKEPVYRPKTTGTYNAQLVRVGVDQLKRTLLGWLKNPSKQIHFSHVLEEEFYKQLTAEKMVIRKVRGYPKMEFVKVRDRNEALDCFVYAYAAQLLLNPNWKAVKQSVKNMIIKQNTPIEPKVEPEYIEEIKKSPRVRQKPRKRSSYVRNY